MTDLHLQSLDHHVLDHRLFHHRRFDHHLYVRLTASERHHRLAAGAERRRLVRRAGT